MMMPRVLSTSAVGAFAVVAISVSGFAQDFSSSELAEMQAKVKIASGLVSLGRAEQDPMMLLVGARILADLNMPVAQPRPDNASTVYDVSTILDEARSLAADAQYILDAIGAVPTESYERSGERYCGWDYDCPYGGDQECGWIYSCNW